MDGSRFDTLTKTLGTYRSHRRALGGLLLGSLGLLSRTRAEKTTAHELKDTCKKKSGEAKKKCKKKAKKHAAAHANEPPPPPCVPQCGSNPCAPDGCGGICQTCTRGAICQGGQCVNGSLALGATCSPGSPRACTSGVCGCHGTECTCRKATCMGDFTVGCSVTVDCCRGYCHDRIICQP